MIGKEHKDTHRQVDFWVHVTEKCDWSCSYCIANTHNSLKTDQSKVLKMIRELPDNCFISLTGGEIGTLDKKSVDDIFALIANKNITACVDTNGLFLRKYPEYYSIVYDYFYHCSEKLLLTDKIFTDDPDNKISYMIVVDDDNFKNAFDFIKSKDILFHVHAAMKNRTSESMLNKLNCLKLFHFCSKQLNTNKEHLKYALNSFVNTNKTKYMDSRL